jgi:Dolichyl-phosphate-mannose-protein mannosyltransferase
MRDAGAADKVADRVALAVLAAVAIAAALTFQDYGLGWDDYTHSQYGDLLLALYGSGFKDQRALSFVNLYKYGGGFDMLAALAAKVLPFGLFETRRLLGAAVGIVGLIATWRLGRRLGGPVAGVSALALLAACPLYYGHMFMNPKDVPLAVAMAVLLLGSARAFEEYPQPSAPTVALFGVALGAAFGSRILAGIAAPEIAGGLALIVWADSRNESWTTAASRLGRFMWTLLPGFVLAYLVMGLLWPWSVLAPLNPLRAVEYFDTFFEKAWRELYEGRLIPVPDMPATYLPHLFLLKLPVLMLLLGLGGAVGALVALMRAAQPLSRRASLLMVMLAVYLPTGVAMVTRPALYNGLRHFIFLVPPFAVLGGLAAAWAIGRAATRGRLMLGVLSAVLAVGIAIPVVGMVRLHPYQYVYFNPLAGGVGGANGRYMLDYWGLAFKQAANALRATLSERHQTKPPDRPWRVAVCGPQPAARVALGGDFDTTDDPQGADFEMKLGAFYCRDLKAPVLAEIKREGVLFARVYDLRGLNVKELLTEPPP